MVQKPSSNFPAASRKAQPPHHGLQAPAGRHLSLREHNAPATLEKAKSVPILGPLTLLTPPLEHCSLSRPFPLILQDLVQRLRPLRGPPLATLHANSRFYFLRSSLWNSATVDLLYCLSPPLNCKPSESSPFLSCFLWHSLLK